MPRAPYLRGVWINAYLLSFLLRFCLDWACAGLIYTLTATVTVSVSLCGHPTALVCLENTCDLCFCFVLSHSMSLTITISFSPLLYILNLEIQTSYLGLSILKSHWLHFDHLWISLLIAIYCKNKVLWWGLKEELLYGQ